MPILQELVAIGGTDNLRFLYERLIAYFPQLSEQEINQININKADYWRKAVQKAGKALDENGFITRTNGIWTITAKGKIEVEAETGGFIPAKPPDENLSHQFIQQLLVEIGESLGYHGETEFEFYDVVWRETASHQRLSHIFEVQSKGNIDSAFAKLKRAYNAQRSKPYLVLSTERDLNRARKSLSREFQDIEKVVKILTFTQVKQVHLNLRGIAEIIKDFLLK